MVLLEGELVSQGFLIFGQPASFFFVFLCFASLIRVIMVLSGFIYLGLKTMPKDIVSKFCFLLGKCGQQVDIKGTIRDSYLFEVD